MAQNAAQPGPSTGVVGTAEQPKKGAGPPKAEQAEKVSAGALALKAARERMVDYQPIKAEVRETVVIGDRKVKATGKYLQGKNLKLRLEFAVSLGTAKNALSGSLLEVCDGDVLFTRHTIGDKVNITRRDVTQIIRAAKASGTIPHNDLVVELGLGGLPALLASLEQAMTFSAPKQEKIDGKPFTVVEGAWKPEYLKRLKGEGAKESTPLPAHVPDLVRVFLDKNQFPHRILYLKRHPKQDFHRPMVTLDFLNIVLRASVDEKEFEFVPPVGILPQDITNVYIQRLKPPAAPRQTNGKPQQPEK